MSVVYQAVRLSKKLGTRVVLGPNTIFATLEMAKKECEKDSLSIFSESLVWEDPILPQSEAKAAANTANNAYFIYEQPVVEDKGN